MLSNTHDKLFGGIDNFRHYVDTHLKYFKEERLASEQNDQQPQTSQQPEDLSIKPPLTYFNPNKRLISPAVTGTRRKSQIQSPNNLMFTNQICSTTETIAAPISQLIEHSYSSPPFKHEPHSPSDSGHSSLLDEHSLPAPVLPQWTQTPRMGLNPTILMEFDKIERESVHMKESFTRQKMDECPIDYGKNLKFFFF